jgi:hypothetical protein
MNVQTGTKAIRLVFALVCLALISGLLSAQVVRISTPSATIPETYFGMHIHSMVVPRPGMNAPDPWPTVPFGAWRLLAAYVDWPNLEPSKGRWQFSTLDNYVNLAEQHNVQILMPLVLTPGWASSRASEKSYYSPGNAAPPKDYDDWKTYVRTVATRYKGRIHYYEIWNEPNLRGFFSGTPQDLVTLTAEASKVLKAVDSTNVVVSPSATTENGVAWLEQFLAAGGGKYVDVIGYHFYVAPSPPEAMIPIVKRVRDVMQKHSVASLPLWDTETGWMIMNHKNVVRARGGAGMYSKVFTDDEAVAYVARSYVVLWASGVSRFYWYAWDDGETGLTEADGTTQKPPAKAYGEIEDWLVGARMVMCDRYSGIWNCRLQRDGGYSGWIVWSTDDAKQFSILPSWGVSRMRDLDGNVRTLFGAKTIGIGPKPILFENRVP